MIGISLHQVTGFEVGQVVELSAKTGTCTRDLLISQIDGSVQKITLYGDKDSLALPSELEQLRYTLAAE